MEEEAMKRERRKQGDYPLPFKLQVIRQIEGGEMTYIQAQNYYGIQGKSTVLVWLRKYGTLDWSNPLRVHMPKSKETPAQRIKRLERELADEQLKNKILNTMIDLSDKQYGTGIRKNYSPKPSGISDNNEE